MIIFASFVRAEDVALPMSGKRFETRLKLLLRWLPTVLITGDTISTTGNVASAVIVEVFYNLN